jgi:predicted nucleic acid-binding protein
VLSEYYATVTRKLRPGLSADEAWEDVSALLAWSPQPVDRTVVARGRDIERRYALSWWDSLIVAAAQLQNCTVLLSEDLQDGLVCSTVVVRNPFAVRSEELRAAYSIPAVPLSTHRRRGRPRRGAPAHP